MNNVKLSYDYNRLSYDYNRCKNVYVIILYKRIVQLMIYIR